MEDDSCAEHFPSSDLSSHSIASPATSRQSLNTNAVSTIPTESAFSDNVLKLKDRRVSFFNSTCTEYLARTRVSNSTNFVLILTLRPKSPSSRYFHSRRSALNMKVELDKRNSTNYQHS